MTPLLGVGGPSSAQHFTVLLLVEFDLMLSFDDELHEFNDGGIEKPESEFAVPVPVPVPIAGEVLFTVTSTTIFSSVAVPEPDLFIQPVGVATLPPIIITRISDSVRPWPFSLGTTDSCASLFIL